MGHNPAQLICLATYVYTLSLQVAPIDNLVLNISWAHNTVFVIQEVFLRKQSDFSSQYMLAVIQLRIAGLLRTYTVENCRIITLSIQFLHVYFFMTIVSNKLYNRGPGPNLLPPVPWPLFSFTMLQQYSGTS